MYSKIKPEANNSLTSSEMIILKSFALGLGCDTIQSLLEINADTYQSYCQVIFKKLKEQESKSKTKMIRKRLLMM